MKRASEAEGEARSEATPSEVRVARGRPRAGSCW
jgi:hypothetical protein